VLEAVTTVPQWLLRQHHWTPGVQHAATALGEAEFAVVPGESAVARCMVESQVRLSGGPRLLLGPSQGRRSQPLARVTSIDHQSVDVAGIVRSSTPELGIRPEETHGCTD
jgi:hypothetical protein